jgi:hypothetical protein
MSDNLIRDEDFYCSRPMVYSIGYLLASGIAHAIHISIAVVVASSFQNSRLYAGSSF